jgi:hypothetical protein
MTSEFETFLSFNDEELAATVAETLKSSDIRFVVDKSKPLFDSTLVDTSIDRNIHIKLRRSDFLKGHKVLEDYYQSLLNNVDPEYYLLSFSDEELKEIITKPDEWGHFDYQLAQKLLKERGFAMDDSILTKLKEERIWDLAQPEKASKLLLIFGYCFIPFGIVIGFFIGRHLLYNKRTLPNGEAIFSYRESDRKHGSRIMIISGLMFILSIIGWIIMLIHDNSNV